MSNSNKSMKPVVVRGLVNIRVLLLLLALSILGQGCAENTRDEDNSAPPPPTLTMKSADTSFIETGIDADVEGIFLSWVPPADASDVNKYRILRSPNPDSIFIPLEDSFGSVLELSPETTSHIDGDPEVWVSESGNASRLFYCVQSVDASGNLSVPSDTACYRLWFRPENMTTTNTGTGIKFAFSLYSLNSDVQSVLLKLDDGVTQKIFRREDGFEQNMDVTVSFDEMADLDLDNTSYRVDIVLADEDTYNITSNPDQHSLSGSESSQKSISISYQEGL